MSDMLSLDRTKVLAISVLVLFSFVLVSPYAIADGEVNVEISPSEITINTTETDSVDILIRNNQATSSTFSISVWPSTTWAGITPNLGKYNVKVAGNSEEMVTLYFTVASDSDEIITTFLVTAQSISNSDISDSAEVKVRVLRKTSVYVSSITLDNYVLNQEGCVNISVDVVNSASASGPYKLTTKIRKSLDILKEFENPIDGIDGNSVEIVENGYCFDKYADAGSYSISAILKTTLNRQVDSRSTSVKISEKSDLIVEKSVEYNLFAQVKTITVKNEGNVNEDDSVVTETVSNFVNNLFYPIDQPTSLSKSENKVIYTWELESLKPGEETVIQYEIRYVSIWFTALVLLIIISLSFSYVYTPRIKKKFTLIGSLKKGKEIPILLEIKNSTIHEIKNVEVTDMVPPIAVLVEKYDTMKPKVKKSSSGIELSWKINSLKPLEERVLTYRIKPNVDIIGSMRLPKVAMEFVNNKKEKKTVSSNTAEIK